MRFIPSFLRKEDLNPMATKYHLLRENGSRLQDENLSAKSLGASHLLTNDAFCKAYSELVQAFQDAICETKPSDHEQRELYFQQVRALSLIVNKLNGYIEEYKIQTAQQQEEMENAAG